MKKRTVRIEFPIPNWVPTYRAVKQVHNNIRYMLFPFRCEETGKRVNFKYPQYEYQHVKRVMVSTHNHVRSRDQWIEYVRRYFDDPAARSNVPSYWGKEMNPTPTECDSCGFYKQTISMAPDIRIGMQWWNGFHVCENCLTETIRLGTEKSSVYAYRDGKAWCVNENGALIAQQPQSTDVTTIVTAPRSQCKKSGAPVPI